jgi:hypothetical protein
MTRRGSDPVPSRCPSCGGRLLWKRYARRDRDGEVLPGLAKDRLGKLIALDAKARPDNDEYANYAVDAAVPGARLITPDAPFDPAVERRHTIHHATHPQCSDRLRGARRGTTR